MVHPREFDGVEAAAVASFDTVAFDCYCTARHIDNYLDIVDHILGHIAINHHNFGYNYHQNIANSRPTYYFAINNTLNFRNSDAIPDNTIYSS